MWKDYNNEIEEIYSEILIIKNFPTVCPVCNKVEIQSKTCQ